MVQRIKEDYLCADYQSRQNLSDNYYKFIDAQKIISASYDIVSKIKNSIENTKTVETVFSRIDDSTRLDTSELTDFIQQNIEIGNIKEVASYLFKAKSSLPKLIYELFCNQIELKIKEKLTYEKPEQSLELLIALKEIKNVSFVQLYDLLFDLRLNKIRNILIYKIPANLQSDEIFAVFVDTICIFDKLPDSNVIEKWISEVIYLVKSHKVAEIKISETNTFLDHHDSLANICLNKFSTNVKHVISLLYLERIIPVVIYDDILSELISRIKHYLPKDSSCISVPFYAFQPFDSLHESLQVLKSRLADFNKLCDLCRECGIPVSEKDAHSQSERIANKLETDVGEYVNQVVDSLLDFQLVYLIGVLQELADLGRFDEVIESILKDHVSRMWSEELVQTYLEGFTSDQLVLESIQNWTIVTAFSTRLNVPTMLSSFAEKIIFYCLSHFDTLPSQFNEYIGLVLSSFIESMAMNCSKFTDRVQYIQLYFDCSFISATFEIECEGSISKIRAMVDPFDLVLIDGNIMKGFLYDNQQRLMF